MTIRKDQIGLIGCTGTIGKVLVWSSTAILYVLILLFYLDILTGAGSLSLEFLLLAGKIKGSLTRDLQLLFFSQISFPHGPKYPIRVISNFYENSQICLKVSTTLAINEKKNLIQKVPYFFEKLLGCSLH